ncbi:hypothetical protein HDE_01234 [Halotydeus destructor]|nr:hypothetical protein HDE_01234 [Halotydeus destructor]
MVLPIKFTPKENNGDDDAILTSSKIGLALRRADSGNRPAGAAAWAVPFGDTNTESGVVKPQPWGQLCMRVTSTAHKAVQHADKVKSALLKDLNEDNFELGLEDQRQEWLPDVPSPSLEAFAKYDDKPENAFKEAFIMMQYFVVGIEQILMDIVLHNGQSVDDMKLLQEDINQIMQEIRYSMHDLGIAVDGDITHDVMSHRFRDMKSSSKRNVRDYLILREYIRALDFVQQLFAHLRVKGRQAT